MAILADFFVENNKLALKFVWKCKGPTIKTNWNKNKVGGFTPPDFKNSKVTIIKTVWHRHKEVHIGQWNRTELEINLHVYGKFLTKKQMQFERVVVSAIGAETI